MKLDCWMENSVEGEHEQTMKVLERYGASDVAHAVTRDELNDEYEFTMYADTDDDISNALAVMLYCNDREPEDIDHITEMLNELLAAHPRQRHG